MTDIIRSAKSGSSWTHNDMVAYNICISFQDAATFFGVAQLPAPAVDSEILTVELADDTDSNDNYQLLSLIDLAMRPSNPHESAAIDFAVSLFRAVGYIHRPCVTRTRQELPFLTCGELKHAEPSVSLINRMTDTVTLLVQEDKCFGGAYAQLIAEAIAAYQMNQCSRIEAGCPRLPGMVIKSPLLPNFKLYTNHES